MSLFRRISKSFTTKPTILHNIYKPTYSILSKNNLCTSSLGEREQMEFDVVIIGAGPAGLSTAIRLKQLAIEQDKELSVCVLEKGAEVGSHILSGNCFNPKVLNELIPDWKEKGAPLNTEVTQDELWYITKTSKIKSPYIPKDMRNDGNYIISLGELCSWMAEQAEELEVDILAGFSASEALFDNNNNVIGVATSDVGLLKDGTPGPNFERGTEIRAKQTILAEGCRGSISEEIISKYNLRDGYNDQTYGIGLKEVWEIPSDMSQPGLVIHALGWPVPSDVYAGYFMYHTNDNKLLIGAVIGLDYENPYMNPYNEFQKLKTHPDISKILQNGQCISYGARAINEGGYQSVPKLTFPGGLIVGCSAGFVNVPKVKGTHYAMKSGIIAAENIIKSIDNETEIKSYESDVRSSWIMSELYKVRNVKPSFNNGQLYGMMHSGLSVAITGGNEPWTLSHGKKCSDKTLPKSKCNEIIYEKPDNKITFDILTNVQRTNTWHEENEPCHLKIKNELKDVPNNESYQIYGAPETRFCPAKVYEYVENENGKMELVINSQNCIHCKTCSIKAPKEYINWCVPQGQSGPKYTAM